MFATTPQFRDASVQPLGEPGHSYWRAVMLTGVYPWYLLTYDIRIGDGGVLRNSMAIAWESTLVSTIDSLGPAAIRGLCSIRITESDQTWAMRHVQTLWLPASSEEATTGPMLFSFRDDPRVYNSHHVVVPQACENRQCLLSLDASV